MNLKLKAKNLLTMIKRTSLEDEEIFSVELEHGGRVVGKLATYVVLGVDGEQQIDQAEISLAQADKESESSKSESDCVLEDVESNLQDSNFGEDTGKELPRDDRESGSESKLNDECNVVSSSEQEKDS